LGEVGLGQPVGGPVLEHGRGGQVPQRVRVAAVAAPVRPLRKSPSRKSPSRKSPSRKSPSRRSGGSRGCPPRGGELELDVVQRDGFGGLPLRGGEQRGAGHPAFGRIRRGGVDR